MQFRAGSTTSGSNAFTHVFDIFLLHELPLKIPSHDLLIFIMGIPLLEKDKYLFLYWIETSAAFMARRNSRGRVGLINYWNVIDNSMRRDDAYVITIIDTGNCLSYVWHQAITWSMITYTTRNKIQGNRTILRCATLLHSVVHVHVQTWRSDVKHHKNGVSGIVILSPGVQRRQCFEIKPLSSVK